MKVGSLRHRIVIESPTRTSDGSGGYSEAWAELERGTVWASIEPAAATPIERIGGEAIQAPLRHVVTIRYHQDVTPSCRIRYQGRTLTIRGVQNFRDQNAQMVLDCEERL